VIAVDVSRVDSTPIIGDEITHFAEQGLIGALLCHPGEYPAVAEHVNVECFVDNWRSRVFSTIADIAARGDALTPEVVCFELDRGGLDCPLVAKIINSRDCHREEAVTWARAVREGHERRRLSNIALHIQELAGNRELEYAGIVDEFDSLVSGPLAPNKSGIGASAVDAVKASMSPRETPKYIPTGIKTLDMAIGGVPRGLPTIIGGRPGMGKSALGLQIALKAMLQGIPAYIVSAEMTKEQCCHRWMSMLSDVPYRIVRELVEDSLNDDPVDATGTPYRTRISAAADELSRLPFVISDSARPKIADIRRSIHQAVRRRMISTPGVVLVDYFQVLNHQEKGSDGRIWAQRQSSDQLRQMAKEMDAAIVILSQLNRAVESRQDKMPIGSDLRDCDAMLEHAGLAMGPFRPYVYDSEKPPDEAMVRVFKCREGPTGLHALRWDGPTMSFRAATYRASDEMLAGARRNAARQRSRAST